MAVLKLSERIEVFKHAGRQKGWFFFKTITDGRCRRADEITLKCRGTGISLIIHAFLCLTSKQVPSQKASKRAKGSISDGVKL